MNNHVSGPVPDEQPNEPPSGLRLTGEGVSRLTPEGRDMLGRMVAGLELRIVPDEGPERQVVRGLSSYYREGWQPEPDIHAAARQLAADYKVVRQLNEKASSSADPQTRESIEYRGADLLEKYFWGGLLEQVHADPLRGEEMAKCLAASADSDDRIVAASLLYKALRVRLVYGTIDAVSDVADRLLVLSRDSSETVRREVADMVEWNLIDVNELIEKGYTGLSDIRDRLAFAVEEANDSEHPTET